MSGFARLTSSVFLLALLSFTVTAQRKTQAKPTAIADVATRQPLARPKLVVGIVVDQMRYDYLYRYYSKFGSDGFRRLMDGGFNARNNHYHYAATYTGPGHAAIYTGSAPALNGIVGNDFYERNMGRLMYCAEDTSVSTVGNTGTAGKMSPRNLLTTTIGDQLKLATNGRAKVIGISLKDRGAIMPAGHAADAAYWFDSKDGNFISSTYYQQSLPDWAQAFNARKLPEQFMAQKWEPSLPLNQYTESTADDEPYESVMAGETKSVFPHTFAIQAGGSKYEPLRTSPYGDQLVKEFALAALKSETVGAAWRNGYALRELFVARLHRPCVWYARHRNGRSIPPARPAVGRFAQSVGRHRGQRPMAGFSVGRSWCGRCARFFCSSTGFRRV